MSTNFIEIGDVIKKYDGSLSHRYVVTGIYRKQVKLKPIKFKTKVKTGETYIVRLKGVELVDKRQLLMQLTNGESTLQRFNHTREMYMTVLGWYCNYIWSDIIIITGDIYIC